MKNENLMSDRPFTLYKFLKNIIIMLSIGVVAILFFFYIYLPATTNHNEAITVPDLLGKSFEDIDQFLTNRNLRYEVVTDSGYAENQPPQVILSQNPKTGMKVKEDRKIYLTLNATIPPQVRMPDLTNTDLLNAEDILETNGLKRGDLSYSPDRRVNAIIEQRMNGEKIEPGTLLYKGSIIDLVIGNGDGIKRFATPNFLLKSLEEVKFQIDASQLKLDDVNYIPNDTVPPNLVYKQLPPVGSIVRTGDLIEVWVNAEKPKENDLN